MIEDLFHEHSTHRDVYRRHILPTTISSAEKVTFPMLPICPMNIEKNKQSNHVYILTVYSYNFVNISYVRLCVNNTRIELIQILIMIPNLSM